MTTAASSVTPDVDAVTLTGAGKRAGKKLSLSVNCELMHNQLPASPVEPNRDIAVVQDSAGNPMLFAIGADGVFRLIRGEAGAATGFTSIDLSTQFAGYSGATAFDVSEDREGRITVVVALAKDKATTVFMASMLSGDPGKTDWSAFAKYAVAIAGIDAKFVAGKILLGTSDDGAAPLATIVGTLGAQQVYYQVTRPDRPARPLEFPENVAPKAGAILDLAIGHIAGDRGVWYLYTEGQSQTLECRTIPNSGSALTYDFSPGYNTIPATLRYACIAVTAGSATDPAALSSDVYVGTATGIKLFRGARSENLETVTDNLKDVHQLVVKQDADSIAVWAVCSPGELYYVRGRKGAPGAPYTWSPPILFRPSIVHVAPLRVRTRKTNELFVVNSDLSVTHHWQDPRTTLWQQRLIRMPKTGYLFNVETFTSRIQLEDDTGLALGDTTVELTASEWSYVTINGAVYSLDLDAPVKVSTDAFGSITVIGLAHDIAPPIIHVRSDVFAETVNVYPNGKVQRGLAAIKSGKDLKDVRVASGPLVEPSIGPDTLDGVASQIGQLTGAGSKYVEGQRPAGTVYVAIENGIKHTGALSFAHLPADFAVGMRLEGGVWRPHANAAAAAAAIHVDSVGGFISDIAGDILHWLDNAFIDGIKYIEKGITHLEDGVTFVIKKVEAGLQFVLQLPGRLVSFVMTTWGALLKALNWILKLIRIGLRKLLEWLGHLFGWDEIWKSHKIIAAIMRHGLDSGIAYADTEIEKARAEMRKMFGELKSRIDGLVLPAGAGAIKPRLLAQKQRQEPAGKAERSAPGGFLHYQIQHGGITDGPPAAAGSVPDPLTAFIDDVILPTAQALIKDLGTDIDDLVKIVSDPSMSLQDIARFLADVADTVIDPVATLVDGMLKFVEDLLAFVKRIVEGEIHIPFLTGFYEFITGLLNDEEKFTFINGCALLVAIPLVEIWRMSGHGAPFDQDADALKSPDLFHNLLGLPRAAPMLAAAPAGGSTVSLSSYSSVAHNFSRFAAAAGAVAGGAKVVLNLLGWAQRSSTTQKPGTLNTWESVAICINLLKFVGTIPLADIRKSSATGITAYVLKAVAFGVSALQAGAQIAIRARLPAATVDMVDGTVICVVDIVVLGLLMVADGLSEADVLTWMADAFSNVGGTLLGFRTATREVKDPATQTIAGIAFAFGTLASFAGVGATVGHAITLDESEILQAVNPGG
ncbi:MAG TPA: hypothetical protein VHA77_05375 [Xanthobacteraceae bacterium]|nr:hypothetical protein [Xanthobacteraceae bacterium]